MGEPTLLGPAKGIVMMADPGEPCLHAVLVQHQADVLADPRGPKPRRGIDVVELLPVAGGIEHQIDGGDLIQRGTLP